MSTFLFGIHCHQPVDNFGHAVREAIDRSYFPLFETLSRHEHFRFSVHFSGWLLERIAMEVPELLSLMQTMSQRGQIEWLGGGYYEPILASIPSQDRRGQLEKLSGLIERLFARRPRGIWLTERVWSDEIIPDLAACGIEYTLVDDYHFWRAGFGNEECEGYYLSESGGETVRLFPISKTLRYQLPFSPPQEAADSIEAIGTAICFDDGEKFGLWPRTYEWVYEQGWLESFASALTRRPGIQTLTFSEYIDTYPSLGLAYLPNTSYYEMGNWSYGARYALMSENAMEILQPHFGERYAQSLLGGGTWKNFLVKYPEANHIHKRMVMLSKDSVRAKEGDEYREWIYKAQTNDVLWHGVFGGLYLPNLRDNAYRYLIEAQAILSREKGYGVQREDIDKDGHEELLLCNTTLCLVASPADGGMIVELDRMEKKFNLQNTLSRREEFYHRDATDQGGAEHAGRVQTIHHAHPTATREISEAIRFDFYRRGSFVDHFCSTDIDHESLKRCDYEEYGDFCLSLFDIADTGPEEVVLRRMGSVAGTAVSLQKSYRIGNDTLDAQIRIDQSVSGSYLYLCEMNLHFADSAQIVVRGDGTRMEERERRFDSLRCLSIEDPYLEETMEMVWNTPCRAYIHPVSTVSQSERGLELTVQGMMIAFGFVYEAPMELEVSIRWKRGGE